MIKYFARMPFLKDSKLIRIYLIFSRYVLQQWFIFTDNFLVIFKILAFKQETLKHKKAMVPYVQ